MGRYVRLADSRVQNGKQPSDKEAPVVNSAGDCTGSGGNAVGSGVSDDGGASNGNGASSGVNGNEGGDICDSGSSSGDGYDGAGWVFETKNTVRSLISFMAQTNRSHKFRVANKPV